MRYLALAADFDGVVANNGIASKAALAALQRLRMSGRRAILITGRRLSHLQESCPDLTQFDYVVAENGAVAYEPRRREETLLASPLPPEFIQRLREEGVEPLEVGEVIVSTWIPQHTAVLKVIQEMGLELHLIFNRAAVIVVPAGINKASGLEYALRKLGLSRHSVVAGSVGAMLQLPPAFRSSNRPNNDGLSNHGQHNQSIEPWRDTSAADRPLPMAA